jgi:cytochrome P450
VAGGGVPQAPRELKQYPFAEALFREALRLHPPVHSVSRQVTGPLEVAGRAIPVGTEFSLDLDHLSRHESLYEEPDRFLPERWLGKSEAISPVEILQFGGGPHFCLGYHLAWMEVVQFAVALARTMAPLGLRPVTGEWPRTHFLPLAHPAPRTRIRWEGMGR